MTILQTAHDEIPMVSAEEIRAGIAAAHQARADMVREAIAGLARTLAPRMSLNRHTYRRSTTTPCASC